MPLVAAREPSCPPPPPTARCPPPSAHLQAKLLSYGAFPCSLTSSMLVYGSPPRRAGPSLPCLMMGWLLRRSPLSSGVPLEGSDTVQARPSS